MAVPRLVLGVLAALVLAYAVVPGWTGIGGDVLNPYTATAVLGVLVLAVAVARQAPRPAWPWVVLIASVAAFVAGDLVYDTIGTDPVLSAADALYLPGFLGVIGATVGFLRLRARQHDLASTIEAAMVGVAALLAVWVLVIEPALGDADLSTPERWVAGLYPVLGAVALFLLVQLLLPGVRARAGVLLTAGVAAIFVADVAYASLQQAAAFETDDTPLIEALWLSGYAFIAAAAAHPSMRDLVRPADADLAFRAGRLVAAGCALLAIPAVYVGASLIDLEPDWVAGAASASIVIPLGLWRVALLQRELARSRDEIALRETYYRSVARHASDLQLVLDGHGTVIDASGARELVADAGTELVGTELTGLVADDDRDLASALLAEVVARPGGTVAGEVRLARGGGDLWAAVRCANLLDEPAVGGIVVNLEDVTERKRAEADLAHQALHDPLTGLANRVLLRDRIEHALARRRRGGGAVVLLFCDLDGFKTVNDSLGHVAGDDLLGVMARRIVSVVREGDTVARLGGDEFAVLLEGDRDLEVEAEAVADRILRVVADPTVVAGHPVVVTTSIGIAVAGRDATAGADDLLRDADTAMYGAKAAGRNQVVRYCPSMREAALRRIELEVDLRSAVERDQLVLHYHPVLELHQRRLVGFEALLRWQHPTRGLLPPAEFIPIAEHSGAIIDIGAWVLETACRAATSWPVPPGADPLMISVNLSARQLGDRDLVARVAAALDEAGLEADRLVLELTESLLVAEPDLASQRLHELKQLGVRLAIDDFGVGYSSLSYLRQFPADVLKVDRSFISMIEAADHLPALVRGLLELGHTLQLATVAEGIETGAQLEALAAGGCELGQGFLFARPLTAEEAEAFVRRSTAARASARARPHG